MFGILLFFFQAEDGIRDSPVTGVQTCALPILNLSPTPQLVFGSFAVRQKSAQPALDACNTAIGHQSHIFLVAFRLWTDQFNTPFQQPFAKRITVVLLIDYDADSIFSRLTTSIHFVSCPPLLFPTSGPLVWFRQNCQQQIVSTQSN